MENKSFNNTSVSAERPRESFKQSVVSCVDEVVNLCNDIERNMTKLGLQSASKSQECE